MNRYVFARGTAVVTGAASGIGEALARDLAGRGSSLVLLDRDADRLAGVAASLAALHPTSSISMLVVDLADREATDAIGARLAAEHPETTLLINCAGVALGGSFTQVSLDDINWLIDINFRATVTLTHHLLPVLRKNPGSHLANVSSVFGIIAPAGQVAYASSKFAVRGFTEALRAESHGTNMGVTCIHPGGIRTRIAESAHMGSGVSAAEAERGKRGMQAALTISPEVAAQVILDGIERRKPRVLIGWTAKLPDLLARLTPGHYTAIVRRLLRV
ncbi:MAG: SDR family NAD(P)-dependent oxidoreductase [Salinibacterium sp.]|nr:SDR family NAD(P)-dependent oxidoreductase [Salinibacterium sp.]